MPLIRPGQPCAKDDVVRLVFCYLSGPYMALRKILKRNRPGLGRLFVLINLQTAGLLILLAILKSDLTPEVTIGQVRLIVGIYALICAIIFALKVVLTRASVYLAVVSWSRRFSRPVLIGFVFPLIALMFVCSIPFEAFFLPRMLDAFWDHNQIRGLVAVGVTFGMDCFVLTLVAFCVLASTRGVRCGGPKSYDITSQATPFAAVTTAILGLFVAALVASLMTNDHVGVTSSVIGHFQILTCRRLLISGC